MSHATEKITLRTVAERVQLSRMTVSLALRGHPSIPQKTQDHVQCIAREMGYRADPVVAELMSKLRTATQRRSDVKIAIITNQYGLMNWRNIPVHRLYFEGAREFAANLGYQVEEFRLFDQGLNEKRLIQILAARGIRGGVIFPILQGSDFHELRLNCDGFYFSTIAYSLRAPALDRACISHMRTMMDACRELRRLGYRRLGLVMDSNQDRRSGHNWIAGFLAWQHLQREVDPIPLLVQEKLDFLDFSSWLRRNRPDAIVHVAREGDILDWIEKAGAKVPQDVGYAYLDLWPTMKDISGMDQQSRNVGAAAMNLVTAALTRHQYGLPRIPNVLMTEGIWREGKTTRILQEKR